MKLPAVLIPDGGDRHKAFVIAFDDSAKFDGEPEITITVIGKCGFSAVDIRDEIVQLWNKEYGAIV